MTHKGHVEKGLILADDPVELPEGAIIRFEIEAEASQSPQSGQTFGERFTEVMGKARSLPEDTAENHDYYLYGVPKK